MRSYILTASALTALVGAQTFTDCNPMEKSCPNDPAIAENFETNFKDGKDAVKGWKQTAGALEFVDAGAEFTVKKTGDAPTIQSEGYLHFGYVEVTMKAAKGAGIVSSIVLESDDLDEVDWEFIGSETSKAQMNYFGKGNTTTYDRMIKADVSNIEEMHRYALNWTADALTWIIDDAPIRTLKFEEANGGKNFPQTPCNVRIGIWAGGDSKDKGTRDWAGGPVDYSQAPFKQTVEKVKIINYSPGKEYEWTDKSGSYKSIKVIDGEGVSGGSSGSNPPETPSNSTATSTPCSEETTPSSTPPPEETPCDCDVLTVTVTGTPPPAESTEAVPPPPPETTPEVPSSTSAVQSESTSCTTSQTTDTPPESTSDVPSPPKTTSPPETSDVPPPPESSAPPETSDVPPPPQTSDSPPPPPETTPISESSSEAPPAPPMTSSSDNCTTMATTTVPPYPTTPSIVTDTNPPPSVPYPTNPTGAIPGNSPNSTSTPLPFTGAASTSAMSYLLAAAAAGIMMFAL